MATIEECVKTLVLQQFGVDEREAVGSASFVEDLGADSLDVEEFHAALEKEFGIEIPKDVAEKITTVQAAVDFCNAHSA